MTDINTGSLWRNIKKGTLYRVWAIATDGAGNTFVIYQADFYGKMPLLGFWIRHSEKDLVGRYLYKRNEIEWDDSVTIEQIGELDSFAWGRPIEMWSSKFEIVEGDRNDSKAD